MSYRQIRSASAIATGLPLDIAGAILDGNRLYVSLSREQAGMSLHMGLSIHQLNILIQELEETRDELIDQLEQDHKLRNARLAEPEDAAPGHERYETYSGVIGGGHACYVESLRSYVDMLYISGSQAGCEFLLIREDGPEHDNLHVGDHIEFERHGSQYGRIVSVTPGDRAADSEPIDWPLLLGEAISAEQTDEWLQDRRREQEQAAQERFA